MTGKTSLDLFEHLCDTLREATGRHLSDALCELDTDTAFPSVPEDFDLITAAAEEIGKALAVGKGDITVPEMLAAVEKHHETYGTSLCPPLIEALKALAAE